MTVMHGDKVRARFWSKVDKDNGCWEWTAETVKGYGRIRIGGQKRPATHVAIELSTGLPVPDGALVLHRCDNPGCVRPDHLFFGTHADNMADKVAKGRQWHPPTGDANFSRRHPERLARGEAHAISVLKESEVREIRRMAEEGVSQYRIAERFGIGQPHVSSIVRRKAWAHVR